MFGLIIDIIALAIGFLVGWWCGKRYGSLEELFAAVKEHLHITDTKKPGDGQS